MTIKKEKKDRFHLRKELNFKAPVDNIKDYIGCNPKGVYYIENSFLTSKPTRYFMYLRKQGMDMNKIFDLILKEEDKKNHNINE
ncbi:hypothetical protein D1631_00035 [Chryseobacterium nematophagum]|uniref:Uncharacterized protein n=1 Tax=Chryseobacterium nematophagum TaxID=2305228 RepID=A0A3M7TL92_9FLAO|nr:hypothetical protein [Chryseobacterium nematophagum]RNA63934.1 hypothetical protein D1631_00035 [Chryseobacterium nematophagum]